MNVTSEAEELLGQVRAEMESDMRYSQQIRAARRLQVAFVYDLSASRSQLMVFAQFHPY